jgi:uncharacterized protein (TIGR02246 family)
MKSFRLSCIFFFIALFACVSLAEPQDRAAGSAADRTAVRNVLSGLSAADNDGNLDSVVSHYREDAILLPPNASVVAGRPAIRAWYEQGLFRHFRCEVSFDADETEVSGDWAFARGYINGRLNPKADEPLIKLHEKFIMILRRDQDGWKIARLIWNSDAPAPVVPK